MDIAIYILLFIALILATIRFGNRHFFIKTQAISVNTEAFLGEKYNDETIYEKSSDGNIYSPFDLSMDPVDALVNVEFNDDFYYNGLELQIVKKTPLSYGAIILLKCKDGSTDSYCTPGIKPPSILHLDPQEPIHETKIDCGFEYTRNNVTFFVKMVDRHQRHIEMTLMDDRPDPQFTEFLTPVGADTGSVPHFFPIIFAQKASFIPYNHGKVVVKIDGIPRKPVRMPIPVDENFVLMTRYSLDPVFGSWNKTFDGRLEPLHTNGAFILHNRNNSYRLVRNAGHIEISKIACREDGRHTLNFIFSPAIPDLKCLKNGINLKGRFTGGIGDMNGIIAGDYNIIRKGRLVTLKVHPTHGWQPTPGNSWVQSFHWNADLNFYDSDVRMKSSWHRT